MNREQSHKSPAPAIFCSWQQNAANACFLSLIPPNQRAETNSPAKISLRFLPADHPAESAHLRPEAPAVLHQ